MSLNATIAEATPRRRRKAVSSEETQVSHISYSPHVILRFAHM